MPFEVYDKAIAAAKEQAMVTIQKRGVISFNRAAFSLLGEPKAVELLYDRERRLVGLRPTDAKVRHAHRVRTNTKSTTYLVSGLSFVSHYDIPCEVGHRWEAQMESDVLFIDLNQEPLA